MMPVPPVPIFEILNEISINSPELAFAGAVISETMRSEKTLKAKS